MLLVDFGLGHEAVLVVDFTEALGTAEEDGWGAGFGEEEKHDDEDWGGGPD